jgi:hypothetical protein
VAAIAVMYHNHKQQEAAVESQRNPGGALRDLKLYYGFFILY